MKSLVVVALTICAGIGFAAAEQSTKTQEPRRMIGPEALWQPGMGIMQTIRDECDSAPDFGQCFASQMQKSGASPEAVAFTKLTGNTGFMRDFRDTGRVDVAYINYPFRANENQGCLLINGDPRVIDVDDSGALSKDFLGKDAGSAKLVERYPNILVFPGDRGGTNHPEVQKLPGGGQRFVVSYRLLNGCHACEQVGSVSVAFDFDAAGKFLGRRMAPGLQKDF